MFMLRVTLVSDSVNVNVNTEHVDQTKQTFLRDTATVSRFHNHSIRNNQEVNYSIV